MVYFDHNATAPLCPEARDAWLAATGNLIGNPSSPHRLGARADHALEEARTGLAAKLGCSPHDVTWTSGATESNNAVFYHASRILPPDSEIWISGVEHPSCHAPAARYFSERMRVLPVDRDGVVDIEQVRQELKSKKPGLLAVMAANNETGVLQPWRELAGLCRSNQVLYFCDATQWLGRLPAAGIGACDYATGSGHKLGAPRGIGFIKWPEGKPKAPLLAGGSQEWGRRAGTENVAGAVAMTVALEVCEAAMNKAGSASASVDGAGISLRLAWRDAFIDRIVQTIPGVRVIGLSRNRLWNTVAVIMPEGACRQRWVVKLDKLGFAVSTGSACSSGSEEPSAVLKAMGYADAEAVRALRFSSGWETGQDDWLALAGALERILKGV